MKDVFTIVSHKINVKNAKKGIIPMIVDYSASAIPLELLIVKFILIMLHVPNAKPISI